MSTKILERPLASSTRATPTYGSDDWESPAGSTAGQVQARAHLPTYRYQGRGDEHWRGQTCHVLPMPALDEDERVVVMACGCQASVPWWTLEALT